MVSVIIVTFNSSKHINSCIKSVINSLKPYQIIIIDNASKDSTLKIINKFNNSKVKIIKNNSNTGFTKACNQGAKLAKGDLLFFLNADSEIVTPNSDKIINKFLSKHQNPGALGFLVINPNSSLQPSFGKFPNILNIILDRVPLLNQKLGMQIRYPQYYERSKQVDWLSGSNLLVKKELFLKAGGFNEKLFMYGEDIDLCKKITLLGYKNYFNPSIRIIHVDSGKNIKNRNPHKYYNMRKGLLFFLKNYHAKWQSLFYLILLRIESKIRLLLVHLMTSFPLLRAGFPFLKKDNISGSIHPRDHARSFLESVIKAEKDGFESWKYYLKETLNLR